MAIFKKKKKYINLSKRDEESSLSLENSNTFKEEPEIKSSNETESFFSMFGNNTPSNSPSINSDLNDSTTMEERKQKLAKRLMNMTSRIEDLENQIYNLQQRIEALEKKQQLKY